MGSCSAGNPVKEESGGGMRDTIGGGVQDPVGGGVRDAIGGGVRDAIGGGVRDAIGGGVRDAIGGGHDQGARTAALSSHSIASFHNANSAPRSPNSKRSTIIWKSFDEARKCVSQLGLKNTKQWLIWSKSGQRPFDIPSNPGKRYPEFKERGGMPYWCGYTPPSTYGSGGVNSLSPIALRHPGDNDIEASPQSEKRTQESSSPKAAQGQVPLHGGGHGFVNTKYGGKSSYTALGRPSHTQPGGLHRQIRCPDGTWSQWVLECGAKHRNAAIKEFNLSANETANLKQTSRRMKLLFAQRRYLARHVREPSLLQQQEEQEEEPGRKMLAAALALAANVLQRPPPKQQQEEARPPPKQQQEEAQPPQKREEEGAPPEQQPPPLLVKQQQPRTAGARPGLIIASD